MAPPWKGAKLGRPPTGPGSLAEPARRLGARILDNLIFLPFVIVVGAIVFVIAAPHFGPIMPSNQADNGPNTLPGFFWIELTVVAVSLVCGLIYIV